MISIILPCYNEEQFIAKAIESLADEYVQQHAEILVIDGMSTDKTVEIAQEYTDKNIPVRVLINEKRLQCYGLNLGISEAKGDIIVRVDAHSTYPEGYVKKLVHLLESTDAANVGGVMLPIGHSRVQQAIAFAMQHPIGVGDARFHLGNYKGYVDTVYLGAFKKEVFEKVGLYDTNCRTNEDAELNIRILKQGGKIYLDSSIEVEYLPRDSFSKLAVQYFRYGRGRAYTTIKHGRVTSFRQLAPPLLVLGLTASLVLSFFNPLFLVVWACYILPVFAASLFTGRKKRIGLLRRLLAGIAFVIMHITWGAGFISFFLWPATPRRGAPIK